MAKLSVRDLDTSGKRVFVRVDFNTPLTEEGAIRDDSRIRAALPTINHLLNNKAKVILASHLGKAKGKPDPRWTMRPVAERLSQLLGRDVILAPDCIGPEVARLVKEAPAGTVVLLENLRFHPGEMENDLTFARELANLAD
ncbi:MAG: phosphoglycerate kinase, partial [candidate division WOR-3 bacterium]